MTSSQSSQLLFFSLQVLLEVFGLIYVYFTSFIFVGIFTFYLPLLLLLNEDNIFSGVINNDLT